MNKKELTKKYGCIANTPMPVLLKQCSKSLKKRILSIAFRQKSTAMIKNLFMFMDKDGRITMRPKLARQVIGHHESLI